MSIIEERRHIVHTAAFWFNAAHKAREEGKNTEAFFNMVNAYNHVENALAACRRSQDDSKRPRAPLPPRRDRNPKGCEIATEEAMEAVERELEERARRKTGEA